MVKKILYWVAAIIGIWTVSTIMFVMTVWWLTYPVPAVKKLTPLNTEKHKLNKDLQHFQRNF